MGCTSCSCATSLSVETLRIAVIEVEADGGVEHLLAHVQRAAEIVGGLGFFGQLHRQGIVRFVMAREELQDCRFLRPFLEHLGRGLDKIIFQVACRPLGVSPQDAVDEVSILVEENDDVVALHEAGSARGLGEVADQDVFGKLEALLASCQSERGVVLVLVFARKHVEVNPADELFLS